MPLLYPPKQATYKNRQEKSKYVYEKYQPLFQGSILDVGADECFLKDYLAPEQVYKGVGLGGSPDIEFNLESGPLPFESNSFDTVMCLDVLEHLENIHAAFDELCRVSRKSVIISLPNGWYQVWNALNGRVYQEDQPLAHYGLPLERQQDRHKWFFNYEEAVNFVRYKAMKNNMKIIQIDWQGGQEEKKWKKRLFRRLLLGEKHNHLNLFASTIWFVLEKQTAQPEN
jgi:predicted SAM-dependent methyltransferase